MGRRPLRDDLHFQPEIALGNEGVHHASVQAFGRLSLVSPRRSSSTPGFRMTLQVPFKSGFGGEKCSGRIPPQPAVEKSPGPRRLLRWRSSSPGTRQLLPRRGPAATRRGSPPPRIIGQDHKGRHLRIARPFRLPWTRGPRRALADRGGAHGTSSSTGPCHVDDIVLSLPSALCPSLQIPRVRIVDSCFAAGSRPSRWSRRLPSCSPVTGRRRGPDSAGARAGAAAEVRRHQGLLRRLHPHLPGRRAQEAADRARARPGQEARQDAVGLHAPERKQFVSDGAKIYFYIPADKQVIVSPVPRRCRGDDAGPVPGGKRAPDDAISRLPSSSCPPGCRPAAWR